MTLDPQGQRLNPLQNLPCVKGRDGRPQIAQQRGARLDDISYRANAFDRLNPDRTMIAGIGGVQRRLAGGMRGPIKIAAIHNDPANRGAIPAQIFRALIHDHRRAMIQWARQQWGGRVIDNQRNTQRAAKCGHFGDGEHL